MSLRVVVFLVRAGRAGSGVSSSIMAGAAGPLDRVQWRAVEDETEPASPPPRRVAPLALAAALAILSAELLRLLHAASLYLRSPYSRDYGEGVILGLTQLLAERGTYFLPLGGSPLVHGIYPPAFIGLLLPLQVALGPTLWVPRLLSLLALAGTVAVVYGLVRRHGLSRTSSVACALLVPAPWFVQTWAPLARVDTLALLLSVGGLLVEERTRDAAGRRRFASFPLFWLAFFAKQSALLAPAAVVIGWLARGEWRRRGPDLLALALPPIALFGLLAALTGGQSFLHLGPYTAAADYDVVAMLKSMRAFAVLAVPTAAIALLGLATVRLPVVPVAFWLLGLASLTTLAKAGAAQNYMIEPWVGTVLLAGVALARLTTAMPRMAESWPALLLPAAFAASFAGGELTRLPLPIRDPAAAVDFAELDRLVRDSPGPVLSENMSVLVMNGKPVVAEPFALLLLQRKGLWDPQPLVDDCRARRFTLVIHEHRLREIPGIASCLDTRYERFTTLGPYEVYRPSVP